MSGQITISIIVAKTRRGVIGNAGSMAWHLPDDFAFFRKMTSGKPIIMGRKTWESLPQRPLKGRPNLVLTCNCQYAADGALVYTSLDACLDAAKNIAFKSSVDEVLIIGGGQVYEEALPIADRIYMTEVDEEIPGDAFFPDIEMSDWRRLLISEHFVDNKHKYPFKIYQLDRCQEIKVQRRVA